MTYEDVSHQPKYVKLNEAQGSIRPPPHRRNIPRYHSNHNSAGRNCLRCICCCSCCIMLLILLFLVLSVSMFFYLKPQTPSYKVDYFSVHAFNVKADSNLFTEFYLSMKVDNPNEKIGFQYRKGGTMNVEYSGSNICSGDIPSFYQGGKSTSNINIDLKGKSWFGPTMQANLMEHRHTGKIPMLMKVKAPVVLVALVMGDIRMRELIVSVNCSLVIDNLSPNQTTKILSSDFKYGFGI